MFDCLYFLKENLAHGFIGFHFFVFFISFGHIYRIGNKTYWKYWLTFEPQREKIHLEILLILNFPRTPCVTLENSLLMKMGPVQCKNISIFKSVILVWYLNES